MLCAQYNLPHKPFLLLRNPATPVVSPLLASLRATVTETTTKEMQTLTVTPYFLLLRS